MALLARYHRGEDASAEGSQAKDIRLRSDASPLGIAGGQ